MWPNFISVNVWIIFCNTSQYQLDHTLTGWRLIQIKYATMPYNYYQHNIITIIKFFNKPKHCAVYNEHIEKQAKAFIFFIIIKQALSFIKSRRHSCKILRYFVVVTAKINSLDYLTFAAALCRFMFRILYALRGVQFFTVVSNFKSK